MFIQTEQTPNPSTLKFLPGRVVMDQGTMDFASADSAGTSPLVKRLGHCFCIHNFCIHFSALSTARDFSPGCSDLTTSSECEPKWARNRVPNLSPSRFCSA